MRKVVLIGHSTGAVHVSLALDQLHATLPVDVLSKLEIYTFGSAASYLSNPCLRIVDTTNGTGARSLNYTRPDGSIASPVKATLASLGHRIEDHERVIPHIEHYALSSDIFARCGVLHNTRNVLDNSFCGRVFVLDDARMSDGSRDANNSKAHGGGGGFLMNEHYLDLLFPLPSTRYAGDADALDLVVSVDVSTAEKREFTAQGVSLPQKSLYSSYRDPNHTPRHSNDGMRSVSGGSGTGEANSPEISPRSRKRASWELAAGMGNDCIRKARVNARECEGKTIRELSRLWRYVGGVRPVGEGVAVCNGVGNSEGNGGRMNGMVNGDTIYVNGKQSDREMGKGMSGNGMGIVQ